MSDILFTVEENTYGIPSDYAQRTSFSVKSCPRPYDVVWDTAEKPQDAIIQVFNENPKNILVVDRNVYDLYLKNEGLDASRIYFIDATEEHKTMQIVLDLASFLETRRFTKGEKLIAVGGGITEDIAAFIGAAYKRGIYWELFPTTLLSMCDSCIGGKTGINYNKAKNQMALFSAPRRVVINQNFLKTLHPREIKSGLGEILKLSVTGGKALVDRYASLVENGKVKAYEYFRPLILGALWVKKAIVEDDEFELNLRRSLNYGHTIGHAVEVLTNYAVPHGQAVALGMIVVDKLSANRGLLDEQNRLYIKKLAQELLSADQTACIHTQGLLDLIQKDKKTIGNKTNFVVMTDLGKTVFLPVELSADVQKELTEIIEKEVKC